LTLEECGHFQVRFNSGRLLCQDFAILFLGFLRTLKDVEIVFRTHQVSFHRIDSLDLGDLRQRLFLAAAHDPRRTHAILGQVATRRNIRWIELNRRHELSFGLAGNKKAFFFICLVTVSAAQPLVIGGHIAIQTDRFLKLSDGAVVVVNFEKCAAHPVVNVRACRVLRLRGLKRGHSLAVLTLIKLLPRGVNESRYVGGVSVGSVAARHRWRGYRHDPQCHRG
jgi:hypothetical protein